MAEIKEVLKKVENDFLTPFSHFKSDEEIPKYFIDFINNHPLRKKITDIICILPVFYRLECFKDDAWKISDNTIPFEINDSNLQDLLDKQNKLNGKQEPFSKKILNVLNGTSYTNNIVVNCGDETKIEKINNTIYFTIQKDKRLFKNKDNPEFIQEYSTKSLFENSDIQIEEPFVVELCRKILLTASHHTIYLRNENETLYYIFSSPIVKYIDNNTLPLRYGLGGLFVLVNNNQLGGMVVDGFEECIEICQKLIDKVSNMLISYYYLKLTKQESIKSAKSAIMARNLSHNLGSHVMAYLKQYLKSVQDVVAKGALVDLLINADFDFNDNDIEKNGWNSCKGKIIEQIINNNKTELPFLVGLGRFISYLQERQDFIATVCTDYVPYYSTVNFKDFIYDELNPDCRSIRHPDVVGLKTDNILLKFIAQSESLTREFEYEKDENGNELKDKVKDYKKEDKNIIIKFGKFNGINAKEKDSEGFNDLEAMRKFEFSLPGGNVGRQAFFSIVENIIRNSAKHGNRKVNNLELIIDIYDKNNLPDNLKNYADYDEIKNDELYIITITDNTTDNTKVVKDLTNEEKGALYENYIDEQGKLLETNKGIKEIRISACYLRGIAVTDEEEYQKSSQQKTPILQLFSTAPQNEERPNECKPDQDHLQYVFCVPKPQNIAFVIPDKPEIDIKECNKNLQKQHCKVFTAEQFKGEKRKNYEFIVAQTDEVKNTILPYSHSRILTDNFETKIKNKFENFKVKECEKDNNGYLCELWEKWLESENELQKITIIDKGDNNQLSDKIQLYQNDDAALDAGNISNFIYRYHHSSKIEYEKFKNKYYSDTFIKQIQFIETITGNNSTDRLIRHEKLDDLWYYKHLSAMQNRIAIIDERLFTKFTGIKQTELSNLKEKSATNNVSMFFKQTNIDFYTLVYNESSKNFDLWGEDFDNKKDNPHSIYKNLAQITQCNSFNVEFEESKKYDFIVIHQGLLDKIYQKFTNYEKQKVTEILFAKFSKNEIFKYKDKNTEKCFLPGFLIHSGRSKPSDKDMPQRQPFIQFSALENAVSDCKYSLVELLTHAHYEK